MKHEQKTECSRNDNAKTDPMKTWIEAIKKDLNMLNSIEEMTPNKTE